MDLKEKLQQVTDLLKTVKTQWVEANPDQTDISIYLHFWRGDDLVVAVQCPLDRDTALNAGMVGATGFNATAMALTFEGYHSNLEKSPLTGEAWRHHEMQYVAETVPDAAEKGWVNECLTTSIHERDGGYIMHSLPYQIRDKKLEWQEDQVISTAGDDSYSGQGVMFDFLQDAMSQKTIEQVIRDQEMGNPIAAGIADQLSDEQRLFHEDMATYRHLEERGLITAIVFQAPKGSEREEWLRERMGDPDEEVEVT